MMAKIGNGYYLMTAATAVQIGLGLVLLFWLLMGTTKGQTPGANNSPQTAPAAVLTPVWESYKGLKIGMTADEVRQKLGKPKLSDSDGFYYEISDYEAAQIRLDAEKRVSVIAVTYSRKNDHALTLTDVFGPDAAVEPTADGRIYQLVRYPEAGFWVAYNRTGGDHPITTITMQRMRQIVETQNTARQ